MPQNNIRIHCIFHGRVQGVFFRANTLEFARRTRVTGWVRNVSDGTVEAVFEGEKDRVEETLHLCREEQPYANVTKTDIAHSNPTGEFDDFTIRG